MRATVACNMQQQHHLCQLDPTTGSYISSNSILQPLSQVLRTLNLDWDPTADSLKTQARAAFGCDTADLCETLQSKMLAEVARREGTG
jgi:hypothetical protein